MSGQIAEQTFEIESRDQQRAETASWSGEFVQSDYKQEVEGNCGTRAQFCQFEFAAFKRAVG